MILGEILEEKFKGYNQYGLEVDALRAQEELNSYILRGQRQKEKDLRTKFERGIEQLKGMRSYVLKAPEVARRFYQMNLGENVLNSIEGVPDGVYRKIENHINDTYGLFPPKVDQQYAPVAAEA